MPPPGEGGDLPGRTPPCPACWVLPRGIGSHISFRPYWGDSRDTEEQGESAQVKGFSLPGPRVSQETLTYGRGRAKAHGAWAAGSETLQSPLVPVCLMPPVLREGPLSSSIPVTTGGGPSRRPAMEGAGKHRFLPSLPSLNATPFAFGGLIPGRGSSGKWEVPGRLSRIWCKETIASEREGEMETG